MPDCICVVCEEKREHRADGMCQACYQSRSRRKEFERNKKHKESHRKFVDKAYRRETCKIIKAHEVKQKNDPESLDIREFLNVRCEEGY